MLKTSSRHVLKTSSTRLEDQQMFAGGLCPVARYVQRWAAVIAWLMPKCLLSWWKYPPTSLAVLWFVKGREWSGKKTQYPSTYIYIYVSLGIFFSWGVANVTNVIFNYILVMVFLFRLNVGVSLFFNCTFLVPVYWVYTCLYLCMLGVYFLFP